MVEVLGEAQDVDDAVRKIPELEPDVVLLDVHMPGGGGVEVIKQVSKQRPQQRFLALSVSDDPDDVIAVVRAGARGYVTKTITGEELADAVGGCATATPSSPPGSPDSSSTPSPVTCPRSRWTPSSTSYCPRARGPPLHRPRLPLQGDRAAPQHLREDRRGPRQLRAPQAPALQPPRAQPLGGQPPFGRLGSGGRRTPPKGHRCTSQSSPCTPSLATSRTWRTSTPPSPQTS